MALSSAISPTLEKIRPFKQSPDLEIDDVFVKAPVDSRTGLPTFCRLSDVVTSDIFRDEFTGATLFASHYFTRDIVNLPGGGRSLKNVKVVDYENLNFADWCVDPSRSAELPRLKGQEREEFVLPADDATPTLETGGGLTLATILGEAIASMPF